jgi:hypothetical protein
MNHSMMHTSMLAHEEPGSFDESPRKRFKIRVRSSLMNRDLPTLAWFISLQEK